MTHIYINGDSWTWGEDLSSSDLWPNMLASDIGISITNEATGCGSNSRVVDCLFNMFATGAHPDMAIIVLTGHHRWHVPSANMGAWSIGPLVAIDDRTGRKDEILRKWMLENSYDVIDSIYRYYRSIWQMQIICDQFDCPVWFFQAWDPDLHKLDLLHDQENRRRFLESCDNDWFRMRYQRGFDFLSNQSIHWKYFEQPLKSLLVAEDLDITGHPNRTGHRKIANYIRNKIKI